MVGKSKAGYADRIQCLDGCWLAGGNCGSQREVGPLCEAVRAPLSLRDTSPKYGPVKTRGRQHGFRGVKASTRKFTVYMSLKIIGWDLAALMVALDRTCCR